MRFSFLIIPVLMIMAGCASTPKPVLKTELLDGSWGLVRTVYRGVVRNHGKGELVYRFYKDGRLVSRIRSEVYRGQWKTKGNRLFAWWPGKHREGHLVSAHTRSELTLVSRDGKLVSYFRRNR